MLFTTKTPRAKALQADERNLLTGHERTFGTDELIVTKTDGRGHITYANPLFCSLAGYTEDELLGAPHNVIRHPHMPRCVFKLLWDTISAGNEIFAYVINRSRNGDHYWVLAHVTPTWDGQGKISGYHSNRRWPHPLTVKNAVAPLYEMLRQEEIRHKNPKDATEAGSAFLHKILNDKRVRYDEFVFSLIRQH